MPKESTLRKNCARRIRDRGGWARAVPQGILGAGMADVIGCYRGYCLVLETKLPGKESTLTQIQAATLEQARSAGAVARVITHVRQVEAIMNAVDQRRDK